MVNHCTLTKPLFGLEFLLFSIVFLYAVPLHRRLTATVYSSRPSREVEESDRPTKGYPNSDMLFSTKNNIV